MTLLGNIGLLLVRSKRVYTTFMKTLGYTERQAIQGLFKELKLSQQNLAPHLGNPGSAQSQKFQSVNLLCRQFNIGVALMGGGRSSSPRKSKVLGL